MRNASSIIIIKKTGRRNNDDDGGGGAWKVAFADFMIALMAFFLVLWIVAVSSQKERDIMATALRDYSVLNGRPTPFSEDGGPIPSQIESSSALVNPPVNRSGSDGGLPTSGEEALEGSENPGKSTDNAGPFPSNPTLNILKDAIEDRASELNLAENIAVDVTPQGVRIMLQDDDQNRMFDPGKSKMAPFYEDMLLEMAPMFAQAQNDLIISGHTDSSPYGTNPLEYSNWELSSERAQMARRVLQAGGVPDANILQVSGMSDSSLLDPVDSDSPANRRIEIFVLTDSAKSSMLSIFGGKGSDSDQTRSDSNRHIDNWKKSANSNQPVLR